MGEVRARVQDHSARFQEEVEEVGIPETQAILLRRHHHLPRTPEEEVEAEVEGIQEGVGEGRPTCYGSISGLRRYLEWYNHCLY